MKKFFSLTQSLVLILALGMAATAAAETIKLGGTGGALGVMEALGDVFNKKYPHLKIEIVSGLGSSGGKKALAAGALDVAVTSKAGKGIEKNEGLISRLYGRAPFVFAVQKKNPVANFTIPEIVEIYSGKKLYWPDGERIRVVLRPLSDTDTPMLNQLAPEMEEILVNAHRRGGMAVGVDDRHAADTIESTKGGVGSSVLALILSEKRSLKAVPLSNVVPSVKTIADGSYRFLKSFYVSTRAEASAQSRLFVDFVLSPDARPILESLGHWVP